MRSGLVRNAVLAACVCGQAWVGVAQQSSALEPALPALQGEVVDGLGKPVDGAVVLMEGADATAAIRQVTTGVSGEFQWGALDLGRYTVWAEKADQRSEGAEVSLARGRSPHLRLVLRATPGGVARGAGVAAGAVELSDGPNFVVAGVTDWTAVGGHGSDATLRTSEDLARETLRLKAEGAGQGRSEQGDRAGSRDQERLQAALAEEPRSYAAQHELGKYYLQLGKYKQALPLLASASAEHGRGAEDEYLLALACRGVGDGEEARRHVQRSLAQKETAAADRLIGELDEQQADPLSAVRYEERAVQLDPSEENYFAWGSELLLHRAVWQASQVFSRGATKYPGSARMRMGWGAALFAGALYEQASQRLCEAAAFDPLDEQAYVLMGQVELAAPTLLPCIEQKLAGYASAHPENATANYLYAMSLKKQQGSPHGSQVEQLLLKAVALKPDYAQAYLELGIVFAGRRDLAQAIACYAKAVHADPALAEAHYRLGVAYDRAGETVQAKDEFALHEALVKAQAGAVEQQRRMVKQFSVAPEGSPPAETNR